MKQQFLLRSESVKKNAISCISNINADADNYLIVKIEERTRSNDQNAKLWAMLNDISNQVVWYGKKLNTESWKHVFSAALKKQETVPGIDGGFVILGQSTSKMKVSEFKDLIELIYAFGAEQGVDWSEESKLAHEWAEQLSRVK